MEENDGIVRNFGFQVFGHAADVNEASRGIVVTVFLHGNAANGKVKGEGGGRNVCGAGKKCRNENTEEGTSKTCKNLS